MKIFVISMNNEVGEKRRSLLNYDYEWIECVSGEEIMDRFRFRHNSSEQFKTATASCFNSHLTILKKIVDEKLDDVIICEDDSLKVFDVDTKNIDEICLLGGRLAHPTSWKLDRDWRKTKESEIIENFKEGVNKIDYEKFRWIHTYAIYYPKWEKTKVYLEKILDSKNKYRPLDNYLASEQLINHLYYPTPFMMNDNNISQIRKSKKGLGMLKDYKIYKYEK